MNNEWIHFNYYKWALLIVHHISGIVRLIMIMMMVVCLGFSFIFQTLCAHSILHKIVYWFFVGLLWRKSQIKMCNVKELHFIIANHLQFWWPRTAFSHSHYLLYINVIVNDDGSSVLVPFPLISSSSLQRGEKRPTITKCSNKYVRIASRWTFIGPNG